MKENGMKIWQGPSLLTGDMIMVVITGLRLKSKNDKTDDMYQSWILLVDEAPHHATKPQGQCGKHTKTSQLHQLKKLGCY